MRHSFCSLNNSVTADRPTDTPSYRVEYSQLKTKDLNGSFRSTAYLLRFTSPEAKWSKCPPFFSDDNYCIVVRSHDISYASFDSLKTECILAHLSVKEDF